MPANSSPNQRHIKFHFSNLEKIPSTGEISYTPISGAFRIHDEGYFVGTHMEPFPAQKNKGRKELEPMGFCIYCKRDADEFGVKLKLTSEHIVPEFLGARLELPESTCQKCQEATSNFEKTMAEELFYAPRKKFGVVDKNGRHQKHSLVADGGREINDFFVTPIADHPTILVMPLLYPASSYSTKERGNDKILRLAVYNINANIRLLEKYDTKNFSSQPVDLVKFSQLLCKIAYSYAMHYFRGREFTSMVSDFIRANYPKEETVTGYFDHVGILWNAPKSSSANLHEIEVGEVTWNGQRICVIRVQLFACLNLPSYYISVGVNSD